MNDFNTIIEIGIVINIKFKNLYNPNSTTPKVIHNIGVINKRNK